MHRMLDLKLTTALPLAALGMSLAGCASLNSNVALSVKGACNSFQAPAYAIQGKTRPDQQWVDDTTESGVAACGWKRPKPRPQPKPAQPIRQPVSTGSHEKIVPPPEPAPPVVFPDLKPIDLTPPAPPPAPPPVKVQEKPPVDTTPVAPPPPAKPQTWMDFIKFWMVH